MIRLPPELKAWPEVSSAYENMTFSREVATRKKGVELMGLGHPYMDALIAYCKGDALMEEVLNIRMDGAPSSLNVRYRFTLKFEDGSKKEIYRTLLLEGEAGPGDLNLLQQEGRAKPAVRESEKDIETRVVALVRNEEAELRANHSNILLIRSACVGIQSVN